MIKHNKKTGHRKGNGSRAKEMNELTKKMKNNERREEDK